MTDTMYGWCPAKQGPHERKAIGYEKTYEPPTYETRKANIAITAPAYTRYFVVWVCDACAKTWWVEDRPNVVEAVA